MFAKLTATELKLFLREPSNVLWGLLFPPALLVVLGCIPGFRTVKPELGRLSTLDEYVPIMICFGFAALLVNALPSVLATYREKGILRRLATTPVAPWRLLGSQGAINVAAAVVSLVAILLVARLGFDVTLPRQAGGFVLTLVLAAAALLGLGLFVTAVAPSAKTANAIAMVLFFANLFFAGLWLPRASMPAVLRHISDFTPMGAAAQAMQDSTTGHWPQLLHLAVLVGCALVFGAAAARLFRWE